MRWVVMALAAPAMIVLALAQTFQSHPVQDTASAVTIELVPVPTLMPGVTGDLETVVTGEGGGEAKLGALVSAAKSWLGVPYVWGGCSPHGVDCSCFAQHVYAAIGVTVPRNTVAQVAAYLPIPRAQLRIGDSLFFNNTCENCGANPTHVGLYLGNGMMIDAGDPVRIEPVYWSKFAEAGRPRGL